MKVGGLLETESDQRFDNNQLVYGLTATAAKIDAFTENDVVALHLNISEVNPFGNEAREAILGSTLETYNRVDFEFLYIYNIGIKHLDTFEVNYRYFKEIDAETAIKQANLDEFNFVTYRLGFKNNLFIAYSSGELPFDQQSDQIFEVGFSYRFE
ncbi:MAG: hypothetical protein GKR87_13475 [Kiritimatiellae bacterium]|nr:hypothetical protein [Kiritimatiellia bacterium]